MANPDIVVGIDFGMTSTGVAYSFAPDWARPETIQNWPGNLRGSLADKVDTKIAYDANGGITGWGFAIDENNTEGYEQYFKLYLDPDFNDGMEDPPNFQEARKWFVDYLSRLFNTIDRYLNDIIPRYPTKRVEFKFSVPTTWKNPAMIAETEQLIRNAGYVESRFHSAEITLTEAEAAAVYAAQQRYEAGQIVLVCDAGGGTSDVNILKVVSAGVGVTELAPLQHVEGRAIGSTLIDFHVEKLIAKRLQPIESLLAEDTATVANKMIKEMSRFESFKCNLGGEVMDHPTLRLSIPGVGSKLTVVPHIENSQMILARQEIEQIFDVQVDRLCELIDEQLYQIERTQPGVLITYLVLSGGLGSSPYLQKKLRQRYLLGKSPHPSIRDLQILRVPKPQLAVCHGLVLDRVQQIKEDRVVYKERFCRNSYGVVYRTEFNPALHAGDPVTFDSRDKKTYALNQIDWFIKQGQKVSVKDGIKQHYSLKVPPQDCSQPWLTQVVMSTLPANQLPSSLNKPGAQRLCVVKSRLPQDMKLKNDKWYQKADSYFKAEFDVRVLIGAADLRFQTLDRSGLLSQDHAAIDVDWQASPQTSSNTTPSMRSPKFENTNLSELSTATGPVDCGPRNGVRSSMRPSEKLFNRLSRQQDRQIGRWA